MYFILCYEYSYIYIVININDVLWGHSDAHIQTAVAWQKGWAEDAQHQSDEEWNTLKTFTWNKNKKSQMGASVQTFHLILSVHNHVCIINSQLCLLIDLTNSEKSINNVEGFQRDVALILQN